MNNLLAGLGLLGVTALAGVAALNYTQQRKLQRQYQREQLARRQDPDAAALAAQMGGVDALLPVHKLPILGEPLDALIDSIVPLNLHGQRYGEALLAAMPDTRRVGGRALLFEALNIHSHHWEYPRAGEQYSLMQLGMQLVQGTHLLKNIDFSEFALAANLYADKVHASAEVPDMRSEMERAKDLEEFVKSADVEILLCVSSRQTPWSAGYIQQHAQRLGLTAGAYPGRMLFSLPWAQDAEAQPIFSLQYDAQAALAEDLGDSALRQIRLTLSVPQVPRHLQPYEKLRQVAIDFAAKMDGYVSDEHGREISVAYMDSMATALDAVYDQLDARDLAAGSPLARRLFA
jgi:hypothetical protein